MKNLWTKSQLRILKKRYSEKGAKYVSKRTGHPVNSVVVKARALNIRSGSVRRWSEFEKRYILKNYPLKTNESIARTLKRSPTSVSNKARRSNIFIPKPKHWSEEELNLLKKLWVDKSYSIDEVAAKLNKRRGATHFKAWKMGLAKAHGVELLDKGTNHVFKEEL